MNRQGPIIKQMYEDIHGNMPESHGTVKSRSGVENKPSNPLSSSGATLKSNSLTSFTASGSSRIASGSGTPKSKMKDLNRKYSVTGTTQKMSPEVALAMFNDKLTTFEKKEIKEYPVVYYLGLKAKKPVVDGEFLDAFDDNDHFYNVIPHDQIAYRYEICEKPNLGRGTFGQVVKAYDHKIQKFVALKLVRNEKIYLKQSREELRILQVLKKQDPDDSYNMVTIKEFFMFRNHMVISFELLGMNLYQVLKRQNFRGFPMTRIQPIAKGLLRCLELLFKNRIIHCDLKPENIMLKRNGEFTSVKVGDFGSSCYEQQQVYHYIQSRYYRAPEVMLGMRYGPAIDVWSLGCVLGELATGYPIITGVDEEDQLAAVEETIGEIPKSLLSKSKSKYPSSRKKNRGPPGSKPLNTILTGDDLFKDLVKLTLEWDPVTRLTPIELQDHPWLAGNRSANMGPSTSNGIIHKRH